MNKIYLAIIVFLLLGAIMIKCTLDTDFSEAEDRKSFLTAFVSWVKQIGSSTKETAKFAVKEQEWLPDEQNIKEAVKDSKDNINESTESTQESKENVGESNTQGDIS